MTATWQTDTTAGSAHVQQLTADTGYLWFFDSANVEAVVKVLDGCALNERYWVFAGGLTDVAVVLTVTDTETGLAVSYANAPHTVFKPIQDTDALACTDAAGANALGGEASLAHSSADAAWQVAALVASRVAPRAPAGQPAAATCAAGAGAVCLNGGRFEVRAVFDAGNGLAGAAHAVKLTADTGYLWFFTASNVEAVVKVLDGCALNQRFWVFAGGLTDVNVELTVKDTSTGLAKTYTNPAHTTFQPIQDTEAFASCSSPDEPGDAPPLASFVASCKLRRCTVRTTSTDDLWIVRYLWDWGDGTPEFESSDADQVHDYLESGHFAINHTVVDTVGQVATIQTYVTPNTPPEAGDDAAATMRDMTVDVDVLANDQDADGDPLTICCVSGQRPGTVVQAVATPSGLVLRVTPPDSFVGVLTFDYLVLDDLGAQDKGSVSLTVQQYGAVTSPPPN